MILPEERTLVPLEGQSAARGIVMVEYRIRISRKAEGGDPTQPRSKLRTLKAGILTFFALAAIVGILLAAFVVGSVIASVLLIVLAVAIVSALVRGLFLRFRREQTNIQTPKK